MPREIVFAPKIYQGIGFKHLYDLQGCDSTRLLLQEINTNGGIIKKMLSALLETIQMESGIGTPILEDTRPLDYIEWGWIPQIRDFLHHIQGKIIGASPIPRIFRVNDSYIMDSPSLREKSYRERMLIHRCRLFLQVETLSDIVDMTGTRILEQWKTDHTPKPSASNKKWPLQANPGKEAWKTWKHFLQEAFEYGTGTLRVQLGAWLQQNRSRTHQQYFDPTTTQLYIKQDELWRMYEMTATTRRQMLFNRQKHELRFEVPESAIPIEIINSTTGNWVTNKTTHTMASAPEKSDPKTLYEKITQHGHGLLNNVQLLREESDLAEILSQATNVVTATDGGFNPDTGISTFGWVIAMRGTLIAKNRGPVAAHPSMAESFRAEGYGIASVAIFLKILIEHFKVTPENHVWKFFIDNKALIQRMESYQWKIQNSTSNLRSDADITNLANEYLKHIPASLIHVKSHQDDTTEYDKLPFEAQMNVMADALATQQHDLMEAH
jgi:hypothetical protein